LYNVQIHKEYKELLLDKEENVQESNKKVKSDDEDIVLDEDTNQDIFEDIDLDSVDIVKLQEKISMLEDEKLREAAEFENLKKRYEKEKLSAIAYSNESFARDLLGVVDSLASASELEVDTQNLQESLEKIKEGISLTVEQLNKILSKNGIEEIIVSDEFDPNLHEAIMQVDSEDKEKGKIVQAFQKGYKYKDRVLRPTMVSIAK
jgi:molecular chaperone GrpE